MQTILHVSKYYYPDRGGIESVAMQLVEGLDDYNNIVICFSNDKDDHIDTINGIKVVRVGVQVSILSQDIALNYYKHLKDIVREYQPNFVHVHCPNPFVYPLVCHIVPKTTKVTLHWHSDILAKGLAYVMIRPVEKAILKRADAIIATSENYISHSAPLLPFKNKTMVLPNGIIPRNFDLKEGDGEHIEKIRQRFDGKPLILFVGRHISYKGINLLIEAEKYIQSDCEILIAGNGPLTSSLQKLAKGRDRIHFLGRLSDDELRWYSWASDIFAFPSTTKAEAFGVALAEAMYCENVPVVFHLEGSGVNWVSEKDVTGIEVPLGDVRSYAQAIDELIANPLRIKEMSKAARERVRKLFSEEIVKSSIKDILRRLS